MKANQSLIRLGPRIKLFRRHVQELNALLIHQNQVRFITKEYEEERAKYYPKDGLAVIQQITNQALRLSDLMKRQSEERHQMKDRHHQEELALEESMDTY